MNITITLPDGTGKQYPSGVTGFEIAQGISEGLARVSLAIEVNGVVWDLSRPITEDAAIKILTWNDAAGNDAGQAKVYSGQSGSVLYTFSGDSVLPETLYRALLPAHE